MREGTHMFSDMWCVGKSVRMHRAAVKERLRGRQRTSGARENISGNLLRRVATSVQFTGVPSAVVYWTIVS